MTYDKSPELPAVDKNPELPTGVLCDKLEIQPNAIKIGQRLGKGNFGTVYKAKWSGADVAVKIIDIEPLKHSSVAPEREIAVLF
jgi:predicted Ser/Thr protein kinase